jgi:hypothetical protein
VIVAPACRAAARTELWVAESWGRSRRAASCSVTFTTTFTSRAGNDQSDDVAAVVPDPHGASRPEEGALHEVLRRRRRVAVRAPGVVDVEPQAARVRRIGSQYCVATPAYTAAIISADGAAAKPAAIGLVPRSAPAEIAAPPLPASGDVIVLT